MARLPADMNEGAEAFNRFRKAMKTIMSVPKSAVVPTHKTAHKLKKPVNPKG